MRSSLLVHACVFVLAIVSTVGTVEGQCLTCPGDLSGNAVRNGADIQAFMDCVFAGSTPSGTCICADVNQDGVLSIQDDLAYFVQVLLTTSACPPANAIELVASGPLVGIGQSIPVLILLAQPAPINGLEISLASSNPAVANVGQNLITIPEGTSSATFLVHGLAYGVTTITASAGGFISGSTQVSVTDSLISLASGLAVVPQQTTGLAVSLGLPAPAGGVTVSFSSTQTGIATITANVFIPEGSRTPIANPDVTGVSFGTTTILANAPGYAPTSTEVLVAPNALNFAPSNFNVVNGQVNSITLKVAVTAPAGGITANLQLSDTNIASIPATATIPQGQTSVNVPVTGLSLGSATLIATAPDLNPATANISVVATPLITLPNVTVGKDLEIQTIGYLGMPAPAGNLVVTITSPDPSKVLLSTSATAGGTTSIMVTVPAGSSQLPPFYVQSLVDNSAVQLTASAPNYADGGAGMITLRPSGFIFAGFCSGCPASFTTTLFAPDTSLAIATCWLNQGTITGSLSTIQPLRGGINPINIAVYSVNAGIGTIVNSPVQIIAGQSTVTANFHPVSVGSTVINLSMPATFTTPSNLQQATANVFDREIIISSVTIGKNLQVASSGFLTTPAPAGNLTVTLTSSDPNRVLLSTSPTAAGSANVGLFVGAGLTAIPVFYFQALSSVGTVQIGATAPGYADGVAIITLRPSGFMFSNFCIGCDLNTTTFSPDTSLTVSPSWLDPETLNGDVYHIQPLRAGHSPVNVTITSSDTAIGTVISPVTLSANQTHAYSSFHPLTAGICDITLATPAGFSTPSNYQQINTTVTAPDIYIGDVTVGRDLQATHFVSLGATPPNPVTVTLTSNDPSKAILSLDPEAIGSTTVSFVNVTSSSVGTVYVQGLTLGTTTLTATAPGYNDETVDVTINPSGFMFSCVGCDSALNTTTFSPDTSLSVSPSWLDPETLNGSFYNIQPLRAGHSPVNVTITSSDTAIGTVISPVTLSDNQTHAPSSFHPLTAGTCNITLETPAGFSTPSNYQQINTTVTAPDIYIGDVTVGRDLQATHFVSLGATPPNPVTVTLTSNDPSKAILSLDPEAIGSTTVSFVNVTSSSVGSVYVQGLTLGTTTLTATAPGYTTGTFNVTVRPSGFMFSNFCIGCDLNTTTFSPDTSLTVSPSWLDPETLNGDVYHIQPLRAGHSPVNVTITSSDTAIGTVISPVTLSANQTHAYSSFHPLTAGDCTISIDTPAGFFTPSNYQNIDTTVITPRIFLSNLIIGKDLQVAASAYLEAPAPTTRILTLTSADSGTVLLSTDSNSLGTGSINLMIEAGSSATQVFFVQALSSSGTVEVAANAPDYQESIAEVSLNPSGFIIGSPNDFTTTSSSENTVININPSWLDPVFLNGSINNIQPLRGGISPVGINLSSSDTSVGVITISPLTMFAGQLQAWTSFDPDSAGMTIISLDPPAPLSFSIPSNFQHITVTVE